MANKGRRRLENRGASDIVDGGIPFEITVTTKDKRPAWKRMYQNKNLGSTSDYYNGSILEGAINSIPGIGDAIDAVKAIDAVSNKDYINAGILGGGLLIPNSIEKSVKLASKTVRNIIRNRGFGLVSPNGEQINWVGRGLGSHIDISPLDNGYLGVDYIKSTAKGNGRKLYDAAIKEAKRRGYEGVESGASLASAPKTYNIWKHYSNKRLLRNNGSHGNGNMINGSFTTKVNTQQELLDATANGVDAAIIKKAPVYGLTNPTNDITVFRFPWTK